MGRRLTDLKDAIKLVSPIVIIIGAVVGFLAWLDWTFKEPLCGLVSFFIGFAVFTGVLFAYGSTRK